MNSIPQLYVTQPLDMYNSTRQHQEGDTGMPELDYAGAAHKESPAPQLWP